MTTLFQMRGTPGPQCWSTESTYISTQRHPLSYKLDIIPDQSPWQASNSRRCWGLQPRSDFCLFTVPMGWIQSTLFLQPQRSHWCSFSITEDNQVNYKETQSISCTNVLGYKIAGEAYEFLHNYYKLQNRKVSYRGQESQF